MPGDGARVKVSIADSRYGKSVRLQADNYPCTGATSRLRGSIYGQVPNEQA